MLFWFFYYIVNISTGLNKHHRDRHQKAVKNIHINMFVHTKGTHTIQTTGTGLHETGQGTESRWKWANISV